MFRLLTIAIVIAFVNADTCPTSDAAKTDCGFVGTNQTGCEASGCCWKASNTSGTPWCFYKSVSPRLATNAMIAPQAVHTDSCGSQGEAPTCPLTFTSKAAPFSDAEVSRANSVCVGPVPRHFMPRRTTIGLTPST